MSDNPVLDRLIAAAHAYTVAHMAFIALSPRDIRNNLRAAVAVQSALRTARSELESAALALDMEATDGNN